ncbi:MAG: PAS domain-containing protein [Alphaproteobacteria bacterium]|nr:PAS domain-containing protein [Alphaproteobacteria bacterium]
MIATLLLAAPTAVALAVLFGLGEASLGEVVLAFAGVVVVLAVVVRVLLGGLNSLLMATDFMASHQDAAPLVRSANPVVTELWLAILRLVRMWRQQLTQRNAELAAAQAVIGALPDPLILLDARRRVIHANAAAEEMFGGELLERDLAAALRNPLVLAAVDAALRGEDGRIVEFALTLPVERQLSARIAPLAHSDSGGAAAILTLHDQTSSKRSEQMRADFVANASHELRTPLATLLGFIETLRGPARDDRDAQARFLAIMQEQAARMARLIDDLLSLSRIEMNEHVPPTGRANLRHVLGSVADTLELRAKARGMRVALDLSLNLPDAVGEPDELAQVFQNLIDNAIKYGREGTSIEVSGRMAQRRVGAGAPLIAIAVRDHGEGIHREHLPRLTERFYRVDTARSREIGGTGLGLAIVKHIVNRHRGTLEIESELGQGSVFTVYLRATGDETATRH